MKTVYGRRFRQARRIRRYSLSLVAKNANVRQPWLSELERSYTADISEETLARLAKVLEFPQKFFLNEPKESLHFGSLLFRGKSSLTDTDADYLAEYAGATGEIFQGLSERASSPHLRLPELPNEASPAEAAAIVRQQFGIKAAEPIDNLVRKAERSGVLVMLLDFDIRLHDRLDAFSCWVGPFAERPVIVLRSGSSWDRLRWSMAHEIGHAVMHRRQREGDIESAANAFASALLLPIDPLHAEWPKVPTIMSLLPLKEKWGLSIQALVEHGFRAGLLDETRRMSLYKQLSNRKWPDGTRWREREPGHDSRETEFPRLLGKMVEVGLGVNTSLDAVSDATGDWPILLLQQLLGVQLVRPRDTHSKSVSVARLEIGRGQIVSLSNWRREEAQDRMSRDKSTG